MVCLQGQQNGQGKANVGIYLSENPEVAAEIESQIRAKELAHLTTAVEESVDS